MHTAPLKRGKVRQFKRTGAVQNAVELLKRVLWHVEKVASASSVTEPFMQMGRKMRRKASRRSKNKKALERPAALALREPGELRRSPAWPFYHQFVVLEGNVQIP